MTYSVTKFGLESLFDDFFAVSRSMFPVSSYPFCDIYTTDNMLVFEFALSGFSKEEINIETKENVLIVSGKKEQKKDDERKYYQAKIAYRDFTTKYLLPSDIDEENPRAYFENGILKIEFDKVVKSKKKIDIK